MKQDHMIAATNVHFYKVVCCTGLTEEISNIVPLREDTTKDNLLTTQQPFNSVINSLPVRFLRPLHPKPTESHINNSLCKESVNIFIQSILHEVSRHPKSTTSKSRRDSYHTVIGSAQVHTGSNTSPVFEQLFDTYFGFM